MRALPVPVRFTPSQPSLLVIIFMPRPVLLCPPPRPRLCGHTVSPQLPCLCLALSCHSLLCGLPPHALTASTAIGRVPQTR